MAKKEITYNEAVNEIEEILYQIESEELDIDILSEYENNDTCKVNCCETMVKQQKLISFT